MTRALIAALAVMLVAAGIPFAMAETMASPPSELATWGGVFAQVPIAGAVGYCFMKFMDYTRERETALLKREAEREAMSLERDRLFAARDERIAEGLKDLGKAVDMLTTNCMRGRNDIQALRSTP